MSLVIQERLRYLDNLLIEAQDAVYSDCCIIWSNHTVSSSIDLITSVAVIIICAKIQQAVVLAYKHNSFIIFYKLMLFILFFFYKKKIPCCQEFMGSGNCTPCTPCGIDEFISAECTTTSDRQCSRCHGSCISGFYRTVKA